MTTIIKLIYYCVNRRQQQKMRDYDRTLEQLENKYGKLTYNEKKGDYSDSGGRIRRINHSLANGDLMDEMEAGIILVSLNDDFGLTLKELEAKYGKLTLDERDYYVDVKGIIRRILPYTPLVR